MKMIRQLYFGSRQAPDPKDHYLEKNGYYRKHCPRDSNCLFRVISEQVYDTQKHHLYMRQRCVDYMRKHQSIYEKAIYTDYDEYLNDLSKETTYGSMNELIVMGRMLKRTVILFEVNNTGHVLYQYPGTEDVFRVFSSFDRHFDSVFTSKFVEVAAFCQSICYTILYSTVFKIPDVEFAVNMMLYPETDDVKSVQNNLNRMHRTRIESNDNQVVKFDGPQETNCILEDSNLCHFHNPDFLKFTNDLNMKYLEYQHFNINTRRVKKTIDSLLEKKNISCVRQLLESGITPFPFKVAKSLDPYMYRNIEFDVWNERKKAEKIDKMVRQSRRSASMLTSRIDITAPRSEDESGADLPKDIPTVQYFYNLGCDYFRKLCINIQHEEYTRQPNRSPTEVHKFENKKCALEVSPKMKSKHYNKNHGAETHKGQYKNYKKNRSGIRYSNEGSADKECTMTRTQFASPNFSNLAVAEEIQWQGNNADNNAEFQNSTTWNHPHVPYVPVNAAEGSEQPAAVLVPQLMPVPYGLYGPTSSPGSHLSYSPRMGTIPAQQPVPVPGGPFGSYPQRFHASGNEIPDSCDAGQCTILDYSSIYYPANSSQPADAGSSPQVLYPPK